VNYLQRCSSPLFKGAFQSQQKTPNQEWHFLAPLQHQLLERYKILEPNLLVCSSGISGWINGADW